MKWIKRLWYRLWLWNALHAIGEISAEENHPLTVPKRKNILWAARRYWECKAEKWQAKLDALDAPDDDSEQLSKRAIPSYMFWPK